MLAQGLVRMRTGFRRLPLCRARRLAEPACSREPPCRCSCLYGRGPQSDRATAMKRTSWWQPCVVVLGTGLALGQVACFVDEETPFETWAPEDDRAAVADGEHGDTQAPDPIGHAAGRGHPPCGGEPDPARPATSSVPLGYCVPQWIAPEPLGKE
jgi:hypothetical protein